MKHESCSHGKGNAWTIEPTRRYFKRCDTCGTLRPWANYFEVYYVDVDREETCWWWECTTSLLKTISDYAEVWRFQREEMGAPEIERAERIQKALTSGLSEDEHLDLESEPDD